MRDGNPPSSWYDPPESRYAYEINLEQPAPPGFECARAKCEEAATMLVEIRDERVRFSGWEVMVCKNHYATVLEDEIELSRECDLDIEED